jgi:hypothetical protein
MIKTKPNERLFEKSLDMSWGGFAVRIHANGASPSECKDRLRRLRNQVMATLESFEP